MFLILIVDWRLFYFIWVSRDMYTRGFRICVQFLISTSYFWPFYLLFRSFVVHFSFAWLLFNNQTLWIHHNLVHNIQPMTHVPALLSTKNTNTHFCSRNTKQFKIKWHSLFIYKIMQSYNQTSTVLRVSIFTIYIWSWATIH